MIKKLNVSTKLNTIELVNVFIRTLISSFPTVQEHKDILNRTLKVSSSNVRLIYIRKLEGSVCV
jgi:hypothetical protein